MSAKLKVLQVGPSVSVQDNGRPGHLRFGVTGSGVMDRSSYAIANAALNNPIGNPAIEVSLGGISLECLEGSLSMAVVGGSFSLLLNDHPIPAWAMFTMNVGDNLKVRPGDWGSWCYIAIAGLVDATPWLDSYAVHLKSGVCGSAIQQGDVLTIGSTSSSVADVTRLADPGLFKPSATIRAVPGPQDRFFADDTLDNLFSKSFTVSAEYDRMGMRLSGCTLTVSARLDMPSEPISRGSLQVPGHGDPICLMADHHTAGGYPKIATVISADLDALCQHRSGAQINFESLTPAQAVAAARTQHKTLQALTDSILLNRVSMAERLWANNLVSGVTNATDTN